jgi:tetratricopeptide (TPR) repeat protein
MDRAGDEARAARERLLDYYQHTAWLAAAHHAGGVHWRAETFPEPSGPTPELLDLADSLAWFRAERANLLAALADDATAPGRRADLTAALAGYLLQDGPWSQAAHLHETAARTAQDAGEPLVQANALCNLSQILRQIGRTRYDEAVESAEQALRIYRELGHRRGEADALYRLGQISYNQGKPADTLATHRLALPIAQEIGDRLAEAQIRHALAQCCELLSDREEARAQNEIAGKLYRELGLPHLEAFVISSLASVAIHDGDLAVGAESGRRGVAIGQEYGHRQVEAGALTNLGRVHSMRGEHDESHAVFLRALRIYEELGYETGQNMVLAYLGPARIEAGDLESAIGYLERGFAVVAAEGAHLYTRLELMRELGFARYMSGDDEGVTLIHDALEAYRGPVDDEQGMAATLNRLGAVALHRGEPAAALDHYGEAEQLARRVGMLIDHAHALDGLARGHEQLGDTAAAAENLRTAMELYRRMGSFELAEAEKRLAALGG